MVPTVPSTICISGRVRLPYLVPESVVKGLTTEVVVASYNGIVQ